MAVIKQGSVAADFSGTVGGVTYSKVRTAHVARTWRAGVNQRTPAQRAHRQQFSKYSSQWFETLTQVQRNAWSAYAPTVIFTNAHGDPYTLTGFLMYMRTNLILSGFLQAENLDAPVIPGLPTSRTLTLSLVHATAIFSVTAVAPAGLAADRLLFHILQFDRVTRNTPRGSVLGETEVAGNMGVPFQLRNYGAPLPGAAGDYVGWAIFYYYDSDNRITNPQLISAVSA